MPLFVNLVIWWVSHNAPNVNATRTMSLTNPAVATTAMQLGFALFESGSVRKNNMVDIMFRNIADTCRS